MALSESEWKLLALKAKNYSANLYGAKNIRYLMADGSKLAWHKSTLQQLQTVPVPEENILPPTYSKMQAMLWAAKRIALKPGSTVNMLFEHAVLISFQLADIEEFILSAFQLNASCNVVLFIIEPDAVIMLREDPQGLAFAKAVRQMGLR